MTKIDMKKEDRCFYSGRKGRFDIVSVPEMNFLQIDGIGDPKRSKAFSRAVAALFALSYNIKFHSKLELGRDYAVMPLEALWSAEGQAVFARQSVGEWRWTAMIRQPDWIETSVFNTVLDLTIGKVNRKRDAATDEATLGRVRLGRWCEGLSIQTLHLGSFEAEAPVVQDMHERAIPQADSRPQGRHHEVYLSDLRRTSSDRLRTLLRQPIVSAQSATATKHDENEVSAGEALA